MQSNSIGVMDSGVGGITTLSALMKALPNENYIYLADKSGAPYGNKSSGYILSRVVSNCAVLLERGVKAIVIACNTATNVGIKELRESGSFLSNCIYIGLEPAIKPAFKELEWGKVLVLLTPATAKQEKFKVLASQFDPSRLIISPQPDLARLIENEVSSYKRQSTHLNIILQSHAIKNTINKILSQYKDIEAIVLGCTHYIYLKEAIEEHFKGRIKIYDGNEGVARHLKNQLKETALLNKDGKSNIEFITI